jgi:hypothetical protein
VVFRRPKALWEPISSRPNLLEYTRLCHSGQCASVNALMSYVLGPQDGLLLCKAEKLALGGPSTLRRFAYTH